MLKGQKDEMKALVRLSALINSSLDLMEVLDNAMKYVEQLMDAEASSIFEADHEQGQLVFRLARGKKGDRALEIRLSMSEGIAGWVAREGKPLVVNDVYRDKRFSPRVDERTGFKTRCIACIPIKHTGRLIGVLEVLNKRGQVFSEQDLEILMVLSNHIGIAIENARLYQRLEKKFTLTAEELKRTQQKVIQSERLKALGRLSQAVAHEVRNPVTVIGGFANRLKERLAPGDSNGKYVDIILKESSRLEQIVAEVENHTKLREPELRGVNLKSLIKYSLSEWRQNKAIRDIQIRLDLPDKKVIFPGDEWLLSLALRNLFQNAEDAMADGGKLTVSAHSEGSQLIICIADTGTGIPPDSLPHVFDPFFTSKAHRSGMGLTTVHRIVSEHNGEVTVQSTPGQGSEFQIRLPLYPDDVQLSTMRSRQERV